MAEQAKAPLHASPSPTHHPQGHPTKEIGLRLVTLDFNREQWENVPSLVTKSFQVFHTNLQSVKRWTDEQDRRNVRVTDTHKELDRRIADADSTLVGVHEKMEVLAERIEELALQMDGQAKVFATCLRQVFYTNTVFWEHFGESFGVDLEVSDEKKQQLTEDIDLDTLTSVGNDYEGRMDKVLSIFDHWRGWRTQATSGSSAMADTIDSLKAANEATRQRLLTWRELLKENSQAVDALSSALGAAQADVTELLEHQVRKRDVDHAVGLKGKQLEELVARTEDRLGSVVQLVDGHMAEVRGSVASMQQSTEVRIEEHSNKVAQLLERSLNPVNAALNTMHVKGDSVRCDVDKLFRDVPALASRLDEVGENLRRVEHKTEAEDCELAARIDGLGDSAEERTRVTEQQIEELFRGLDGVRSDFGDKVQDVSHNLQKTTGLLKEVREGDLITVANDIASLEQKVAKWIHAHPLPAKISEARLFALEARLAEESDSRVKLEETMRSQANLGNAHSGLPFLGAGRQSKTAPGSARRPMSMGGL
eukprot:TRINITY_DN123144_c0_g1_i1.p1 TRINITY_DN123144_c0_g1~~TRINITY_DN123144_c0_g1_i1.p1  ORF type:complete len:537 (-),score=117.62 TRINITY_DN123144_c0_g1_i1:178-1788(-)